VDVNGKKSQLKSIDRGCPQGSVLGPVLFNLYTGTIKNNLPNEAFLTSYADDSYVVLSNEDEDLLIKDVENCLRTHIGSLERIGMKVNEEKTEIMLFGKTSPRVLVNVKGTAVESKDHMKALGIVIDKGLTWGPHIASLKKRVMKIVGGVRIVRNKLNKAQATSVVTAQVFSVLYYACCVWLTPVLNKKDLNVINRLHFRALRLILRDYRQRISRDTITSQTKRLPPDKWAKFVLASLFLNSYNIKKPASLIHQLSSNFYSKRRKPGFYYAYDSAKSKTGKQSTKNWIGSAIGEIQDPWTNKILSKDSVRVLLKKTFKTN